MKPQSNGNYFFDPNSFTENATDNSVAPCSPVRYSDATIQLVGHDSATPRTICCGPSISNTDFAVLKTFTISENEAR